MMPTISAASRPFAQTDDERRQHARLLSVPRAMSGDRVALFG